MFETLCDICQAAEISSSGLSNTFMSVVLVNWFGLRNGDITLLNAHAVVCCNNESLTDNDPVTAGTLLRAGPELRREMLNEIKGLFSLSVYLFLCLSDICVLSLFIFSRALQEELEFIPVNYLYSWQNLLNRLLANSFTKTVARR